MAEKWIIPCNIKHFDLISYFKDNRFVVWKNSFSIKKDDIAYIYIGSPIRQIKYRCRVISDVVSDEMLQKNQYAISEEKNNNYFSKKVKYIILELEQEYQDGVLLYNDLKLNGLGQVQIQARTDRRLQRYIDEVETKIAGGEIIE